MPCYSISSRSRVPRGGERAQRRNIHSDLGRGASRSSCGASFLSCTSTVAAVIAGRASPAHICIAVNSWPSYNRPAIPVHLQLNGPGFCVCICVCARVLFWCASVFKCCFRPRLRVLCVRVDSARAYVFFVYEFFCSVRKVRVSFIAYYICFASVHFPSHTRFLDVEHRIPARAIILRARLVFSPRTTLDLVHTSSTSRSPSMPRTRYVLFSRTSRDRARAHHRRRR